MDCESRSFIGVDAIQNQIFSKETKLNTGPTLRFVNLGRVTEQLYYLNPETSAPKRGGPLINMERECRSCTMIRECLKFEAELLPYIAYITQFYLLLHTTNVHPVSSDSMSMSIRAIGRPMADLNRCVS